VKVLFVTGKLAEPLLRETLAEAGLGFEWEVAAMKITVAALMTPEWIARFLEPPPGTDLILLPGMVQGEVAPVRERFGIRAEKGPKDLRQIPEHFGLAALRRDYGAYDVQILAEINDAPSLPLGEIVRRARYYAESGAEIIDVGCTPGRPFPSLAGVVGALRAEGHRVSVDSFDAAEVRAAVGAGAEMVLSVNGTNLETARELDATFVVIPDPGTGLETLERSLDTLSGWGVRHVADPILEPIGYGAAESLHRYHQLRRRRPEVEILMGIANLTELTEADTTGTNALLLAYCQELGIRWVLTTEAIPWARGAVREVDIARRLMYHAVRNRALPKHLDSRLLTVKDPEVLVYGEAELRQLQAQLTDLNFRIYTDRERIYIFNAERFVAGTDPAALFAQLDVREATHAFYLGRELTKAKLALSLGKTYRQEGELAWGYLTPQEDDAAGHAAADREGRLRSARERADRRRAAERGREAAG
jgi:dihydropteroate synthase-like protein